MIFSWERLPKLFTVMAPMEGVTDTVFRQMIAAIHKPDVMCTEFVSVEGMNSTGRDEIISKLRFSDSERPLIAQLWGVTPKLFYRSAKDIVAMGFDGIDINMGCPDKNVLKVGAGAALIENPDLAGRIIEAVRDGVRTTGKFLPVSVKTRIGLSKRTTEEWARFLLSHHPDALTVHGLTAKEQYKKPADWGEIKKVVDIRNRGNSRTVIIGNGNVTSYGQALLRGSESSVDGIMIGRGVLQNCNCFDPDGRILSRTELAHALVRHLKLFEKLYGVQYYKFVLMKKFFKMYVRDFEGSGFLRNALMETKSVREAVELIAGLDTKEAETGCEVSLNPQI